MNIRLYHPDSIVENTTSLLSKEHTHYVVNVMRLKRGSKLNFFNKNGEWKSEVIFLVKDRVEVKFLERYIATCLGLATVLDLLAELISETFILKC